MEQGWVWDLDDFGVNQIGHPYQGNNYFNAGRGNGLTFWESAGITAFGSATWEYDMDTQPGYTLTLRWDARKVTGVEKGPALWKDNFVRDERLGF